MRLLPLLALLLSPVALAVPQTVLHQARLLDSTGAPVTGSHDVAIRLFDAETGGTQQFEQADTLDLDDGYLAVEVGPIPSAALDRPQLWVELEVDDHVLGARLPLVSVPYALRAGGVTGPVDATSISVGGSPFVDDGGNISAGDVSAGQVAAGGVNVTTLEAVTVDAQQIDVGGATVITGDGEFVGSLLGGALSTDTCDADEALVFDGSEWGCGPAFPGTVSWLDLTDRPVTLSDLSCADGQVPTATSAGWTCAGGAAAHPTVGWLTVAGFASGVPLPLELPVTDFAIGWTRPVSNFQPQSRYTSSWTLSLGADSELAWLLALEGRTQLDLTLAVPDGAGGRVTFAHTQHAWIVDFARTGTGATVTLVPNDLSLTWAGKTASVASNGAVTQCASPPASLRFAADPGPGDPLPSDVVVDTWSLPTHAPIAANTGLPGRLVADDAVVSGAAPADAACLAGFLLLPAPLPGASLAVVDPTSTGAVGHYTTEEIAECPAYVTSVAYSPRAGGGLDVKATLSSAAWRLVDNQFSPDVTGSSRWNFLDNNATSTSCSPPN